MRYTTFSSEMDEGFQINGIALGTNWDSDAVPATAVIPKQEFTASCQGKTRCYKGCYKDDFRKFPLITLIRFWRIHELR